MKIYTCVDFTGHWPVGSAAVVVAKDEEMARKILLTELHKIGLGSEFTLQELDIDYQNARILCDGNY
jgi:hypothetical protein